MKIQYVLEEHELIEALNEAMVEFAEGTTTHYRKDKEPYNPWKKKTPLLTLRCLAVWRMILCENLRSMS